MTTEDELVEAVRAAWHTYFVQAIPDPEEPVFRTYRVVTADGIVAIGGDYECSDDAHAECERMNARAVIPIIRNAAMDEAAAVATERAASRERLFNENGASINAAKTVEAEEIAQAILALKGEQG